MISLVIYVLSILLWYLYSLLEGDREGYYYHAAVENNDANRFNMHPVFFVQRLCVFILIGLPLSVALGKLAIIILISMPLSFSYFHNGAYYTTRNYLNNSIYKERWKADSKQSSALFNFNFKERFIHFIISLVLVIIGFVILVNFYL